jgi:hypothetical protein
LGVGGLGGVVFGFGDLGFQAGLVLAEFGAALVEVADELGVGVVDEFEVAGQPPAAGFGVGRVDPGRPRALPYLGHAPRGDEHLAGEVPDVVVLPSSLVDESDRAVLPTTSRWWPRSCGRLPRG